MPAIGNGAFDAYRGSERLFGTKASETHPSGAEADRRDAARPDTGCRTELTARFDLSAGPEGSRLICRRERPHPGAQFTIFDEHADRHTRWVID